MTDTTDIAHFQMEAEVRQIKIQLRLESDFHSASLFVFSSDLFHLHVLFLYHRYLPDYYMFFSCLQVLHTLHRFSPTEYR